MSQVFLGGTCGGSTWRDEIAIPKLNEADGSGWSMLNAIMTGRGPAVVWTRLVE